jgi:hypothetical protein
LQLCWHLLVPLQKPVVVASPDTQPLVVVTAAMQLQLVSFAPYNNDNNRYFLCRVTFTDLLYEFGRP